MTNLANDFTDVSEYYLEGNEIGAASCTGIDESFSLINDEPGVHRLPPRYARRGAARRLKSFRRKKQAEPLILSYQDVVFNGGSEMSTASRRFSYHFPEMLVAFLLLIYFLLVALSLFFDVNVVPSLNTSKGLNVRAAESSEALLY